MCIQTKQWFTFHIEPTITDSLYVDLYNPFNKAMLEKGVERHGMSWTDGTYKFNDVMVIIHEMIPKDADVFINDVDLISIFTNQWGYEEVQRVGLPPMANLNNHPHSTCGSYGHVDGFKHCAQRKCFEAISYLNQTLVPYLDPTILKYPGKLVLPSDFDVKFGEMKLHPKSYQKLSQVRLPIYFNAATNCQFCVAGSDGCSCTTQEACKKGDDDTEHMESEASNQTAGTIDCEI